MKYDPTKIGYIWATKSFFQAMYFYLEPTYIIPGVMYTSFSGQSYFGSARDCLPVEVVNILIFLAFYIKMLNKVFFYGQLGKSQSHVLINTILLLPVFKDSPFKQHII